MILLWLGSLRGRWLEAACGVSQSQPDRGHAWGPAMNLEGLEMVAVLVVLALFVKVLEQFGLFEPVSLEGNPGVWACLNSWLEDQPPCSFGEGLVPSS